MGAQGNVDGGVPFLFRLALRIGLVLLVLSAAELYLLRTGRVEHSPRWLAALAGLAMLALTVRLAGIVFVLARQPARRFTRLAEILFLGGFLIALGGGMANWALGLQGFLVLLEREARPLFGGTHLDRLDAGPLADIGEMDVTLELLDVELAHDPNGGLVPTSTILLQRGGGSGKQIQLGPQSSATSGSLRFQQGAFGFAPRIVVVREGRTLFDRVVPFTSDRADGRFVTSRGELTVEKENLTVSGIVSLDSLDDGMKGHPTLQVAVFKNDQLIGSGELLPGHFADLDFGYRVGFAGLKHWSEIDVSRKNYPKPVKWGLGVALAGALFLFVAVWRRW